MKRFALRGALVGLAASVLALILPEIVGSSIMYILPFLFLLAPSFTLVFYIFPLHGAPIEVFIGVYGVLTVINMLFYAGVAAILWRLYEKPKATD
jgi:hypothetical protein